MAVEFLPNGISASDFEVVPLDSRATTKTEKACVQWLAATVTNQAIEKANQEAIEDAKVVDFLAERIRRRGF